MTTSRGLPWFDLGKCGKIPFAKLLDRLFGERLVFVNATGCTSIRGELALSTPCRIDTQDIVLGRHRSWPDDSGAFSCDMLLALLHQRRTLADMAEQAQETAINSSIKKALEEWLNHLNDPVESKHFGDQLMKILPQYTYIRLIDEIHRRSSLFAKQSFWVFVGDGSTCDITCGGIDHVLATGEDINVMVIESTVDSSADSPSSTANTTSAMAMAHDHIHVANVFTGASEKQSIKTFTEAEAYDGPALIIANAARTNHGIEEGSGDTR